MKSLMALPALAAGVAFAISLVACTTPSNNDGIAQNGQVKAAPTPAQIAAQVCPPVQTAMTGLNALVGLLEGAQKDLAAVTPIVAGVCAIGASVNTANLQQLAQTALPAIVNAVKVSALTAEEQNAIIVDVTAAQLILAAVTQAQTNLAAPAQH